MGSAPSLPLLERSGISLTDRSHLNSYIPQILTVERDKIAEEIRGRFITVMFDGTTRSGEAVNTMYRYCLPDFSKIEQRLVDFTTVKQHFSGQRLGQYLNHIISTGPAKMPPMQVVGAARDSVATNGAGLAIILPLFEAMLDVKCYAHLIQNVGPKFDFKNAESFVTAWSALQKLPVIRSMWNELAGTNMKGFSTIRWWSRHELFTDLARHFDRLPSFVVKLTAEAFSLKAMGMQAPQG